MVTEALAVSVPELAPPGNSADRPPSESRQSQWEWIIQPDQGVCSCQNKKAHRAQVVAISHPSTSSRESFVDSFSHLFPWEADPVRLPEDSVQFDSGEIVSAGKLLGKGCLPRTRLANDDDSLMPDATCIVFGRQRSKCLFSFSSYGLGVDGFLFCHQCGSLPATPEVAKAE